MANSPHTPQDTVTSVHNIPRGVDPASVLDRASVEALIDHRIAEQVHRIVEARDEAKKEVYKRRFVLSGLGAVAGLGAGIGGTLLVQKIRRGRGGNSMK